MSLNREFLNTLSPRNKKFESKYPSSVSVNILIACSYLMNVQIAPNVLFTINSWPQNIVG